MEEFAADNVNRSKPMFVPQNVLDGRLVVADSVPFGVLKGAQNVTMYSEKATSATPSGCNFSSTFNLSTIVDRRVLWRSDIVITVSKSAVANGGYACDYGNDCVIASYPAHRWCQNQQATINSASTSFATRDVLDPILKLMDADTINKYATMTPTKGDKYASLTEDLVAADGSYRDYRGSAGYHHVPNGCFDVVVTDTASPADNGTATTTIAFTTVEPLIMSPFLVNAVPLSDGGGMYGVSNLRFIFNFGDASRMLRLANMTNRTVTASINNSYLDYQLLTPHPSLKMPSRNICGYTEVNKYQTNVSFSASNGSNAVVKSNTVQLPSIPDKMLFMCRPIVGNMTAASMDQYLPISKLNISFGNQSGILSSVTEHQLYSMSKKNGLNVDWSQYHGRIPKRTAANTQAKVALCGAPVVLELGTDVNLTDDFYAPSSLGSFNCNFEATVENRSGADLTNVTYELVLITLNAGLLVNELGSSSTYVGLLTKEDVIKTSQLDPSSASLERLYGGGWWSSFKRGFKTGFGSVMRPAAKVADALGTVVPEARIASSIFKGANRVLGSGYSAGGKLNGRLKK